MVKQYPHIVKVTTVTEGQQDAGGKFIKPTSSTIEIQGRYEPYPTIREVTTTDGKVILSKGVIYLPLKTETIPDQSKIEVVGYANGFSLYFYKGQMNRRLFI